MMHISAASAAPQVLNVPELHPGLAGEKPGGVAFFDPGVAQAADGLKLFAPHTLPLERDQARGLVERFAQLARETRDPRELAGLWGRADGDFYADTTFAIRDQLADQVSGALEAKRLRQALIKAQTMLCLAWVLEEAALDISRLDERLDGQWRRFEHELGLDEDDRSAADSQALLGAGPPSLGSITGLVLPKPLLIESVLAFLPDVAGLFASDADLIAQWMEYGLDFSQAKAGDLEGFGLDPAGAGAMRLALAPGHLLALAKRPDPEKPWLNAQRTVFIPAP